VNVKALDKYREKRVFKSTPEPDSQGATSSSRLYVIQKHAASTLHYDLRLAHHGLLLSWAVPKGPSLDPHVKRLAVEVEPHPLEYGNFQGDIPAGNYGAGHVDIWDTGVWEAFGDSERALKDGSLKFTLFGVKLRGKWALIRTGKSADSNQWLLIKERDEFCRSSNEFEVTSALPDRVVAGPSNRNDSPSTRYLPERITPELASRGALPTDADRRWVYELKFDGYRLMARKDGGGVRLFTRNGFDWTSRLPRIAAAVQALPFTDGWLDGELVYIDDDGTTHFNLLEEAVGHDDSHLGYFVFDAPLLNGLDLRGTTLTLRYDALKALVSASVGTVLRLSEQFDAPPASLLASACKLGLEGLVAKRKDSTYTGKRSGNWVKLKCGSRQEFVVIGFVPSTAPGRHFKSILVGERDDSGTLVYAGNVGTGFTTQQLTKLYQQFKNTVIATPLPSVPAALRRVGKWVAPELVVEVSFDARTKDHHLRHAVFRGVRSDKVGDEVIREATPVKAPAFSVTHAERVVDPASGATKGEVAAYYAAIAPLLLPELHNRPCALLRAPDGLGGSVFFQRHTETITGNSVKSITSKIGSDGKALTVINSMGALHACAQHSTIEIHSTNARLPLLEKPDRIVFDLDPGDGVAWSMIREGALLLKTLLDELALPSFVKTSGGKGLHVIVPIVRRYSSMQVKALSSAVVHHLAQVAPKRFVAKSGPRNRVGRIYVDYLRNGSGATTACAWTLRARDGLPVSVPIGWDELASVQSANQWTLRDIAARAEKVGNAPWASYGASATSLGEAAKRLGFDMTE